jgi:protein-S-isoprenylcysteine O-methyltransferase Ste14
MDLLQRAILSLVALIAVMAAIVFIAAGTLDYWQAWTFLAVYASASLAIILYLAQKDPALLARRMKGGPLAEKEPAQKIIMSLTLLGFIGLLVMPALDYRFGWSQMPSAIAIAGDALILFGWIAILLVFKENSFTAATIEVVPGQHVITTGPYSIVRHPMYAGTACSSSSQSCPR